MKKMFFLKYIYKINFYYERIPFHFEHIKYFNKLNEKPDISVTGGTEFPHDSGFLFFQGLSESEIKDYIKNDPFYKNGLVLNYKLEEVEEVGKKDIESLSREYSYLCK